jgi:hypothetical protein
MPRSSDVAGVLTMCGPQQARHERAAYQGNRSGFEGTSDQYACRLINDGSVTADSSGQ